MAEGPRADDLLPSLEEAEGWAGFEVDAIDESGVGRVDGIFVDSESGEPAWVIVKPGRFGRDVAIPFRDCAAVVGRVWVPYSWRVLLEAPVVDRSRQLTREQELAICARYGIDPGRGRAAEVAGRPDGAVTARPAGPRG
jgi:hypothetical protein